MSHYFTDDGKKHELRYIDYEFAGKKFKFATHDGVFSKGHVDYATDILLKALPPLRGRVLDMGCGYGVIGIVLAKVNSIELTMADINPAAIALTERNCELNGVKAEVIVSDCCEQISGKFDTVVINPPIHAGKEVTYKMYEDASKISGKLYVVTLKKHGAQSTIAKLRELFGNCELLYKKKGIYVLCSEKQ
ncbi:MAG: methyltransferase [Oscillospiraceae bacterium]|nr:methyltransferase [Oscillospiraceae bacterium]